MTALLVRAQVKAHVHGMVALQVALKVIPISHRLSTTKINLIMTLVCLPMAAIQDAIILSAMTAGIHPPMAAIQGVIILSAMTLGIHPPMEATQGEIILLVAMTGTQILGLPILGNGNHPVVKMETHVGISGVRWTI